MKKILITLLVFNLCHSIYASGFIVKNGEKIDEVARQMKKSGYKETILQIATSEGNDLKVWHVGKGYLIAEYSIKTKLITSLTYTLIGKGSKAKRDEFDFQVLEFNAIKREMKITLNKSIHQTENRFADFSRYS